MAKETLSVTDNRTGKNYELTIENGCIRAADLRQIKNSAEDFGLMAYDPAFLNTANCKSAITFIDGDKGILEYRGYPIEQLAEKSSYLEVAYLLLNGELPTAKQLEDWQHEVTYHTILNENMKSLLDAFRYDAHPMGRVICSAHADPYSAVAGAAAALYGPLHGGANEAVIHMLNEIGSVKNVPAFIEKVKAGEGRLMGFGHRVYKNYDPRARIIKKAAYDVFEVTGKNPLLDIALELEKIALEDEYFVKRKLYPNVDFYSGLIYQALKVPMEMFTVMFAIP